MFNSLKGKIVIPSIGVLTLLVVVLILYSVTSVSNFAHEITQQRLETAIQTTNAYMDSIRERSRITSLAMAENSMVLEHLQNWNAGENAAQSREALLNYLNSVKSELGVDTFVIVDRNFNVMLRSHAPAAYNDSVHGVPLFMLGMSGVPVPSFSTTSAVPMSLSDLAPIWYNGEVIGTMSINTVMSNDAFVDRFAEVLNAEITVFAGSTRVATTLKDERGQRTIGTDAPEHITQAVITADSRYSGEVELQGRPFNAYYFPLHGWDNDVIGMFFAGFSNEHTVNTTNRLQTTLVIFGVIGLIIAAAIMFYLIASSLKPVGKLVEVVKNVTAGRLNMNMDRSRLPKDEIGTLTLDVYDLCNVIKGMTDDIARFSHEVSVNGDVEYSIDTSKYTGNYSEMMTALNDFSRSYAGDVMTILGVLENVNNGDFNAELKKQPGKKAIMNTAVDALMANLNGVNAEVNGMINASVNGDFNFKADADKYKGGWQKIMVGLNDIAKAVDVPLQVIKASFDEMTAGRFDLDALIKKLDAMGLESDTAKYKGVFKEVAGSIDTTMTDIASYINELDEILAQMASGDLRNKIDRKYVGSFDLIKTSVNNISDTLRKTMSEISTASSQVFSGAKQISSSAMDLANGASSQASSVQELNASVDLINQQTLANAENANQANELSNTSTSNAREGNEAMQATLGAMNQIKDASNNISKIIRTIQDIAFQTNLLALNAAVEAARAGEHGKGFAVVAEEVRSLAARSQEAASETTSLISTSINTVDSGADMARSTAETLDTIVENANKVLNVVSVIAKSSQEQAEAISQIVTGIGQISQVVQANSAVSEETAAASEELTSQAELLQQLVSFFKV
ncbi:MAG: methyl-accepting chemotaxis protein [Defluviitaleaceae bacterium]|nr:methyl-accepting chemotaxis protein [Defluviitaleaceae bacterium]MCL2263241.1 methyl-accepting chemotaxis protein [Defluviitaleaceae bacterium]